MDIPYTVRSCVRLFWNRGFDCERIGVSHSSDFGIPHTSIHLGRFGYVEVFWKAVR